jgi:hypothetical protein
MDNLDQESGKCWVPPSQRKISISNVHNLASGTLDGDKVLVFRLDLLYWCHFPKALLRGVLPDDCTPSSFILSWLASS